MPMAQTPSKLSVDFSNVDERREGGKAAHVPEGDYLLKVVGCELKSKQGDESSKYLNWRLEIVEPSKYRNAGAIWHVTSLKPEALWNLRNFLEDLGMAVPRKAVDLPIATIVKKQLVIGATLADDEYTKPGSDKSTVKSKIQATFKKDAFEGATASDEDETATADDEDEEVDELDVDDL